MGPGRASLGAATLLGVFVALAAWSWVPAEAQSGGPGKSFVSKAFTHRVHLQKETQDECALCHTAEAEARPQGERSHVVFDRCASCHAKEKSIEVALAWRPQEARFPRFYHDKHASVQCAACHEYDRTSDRFTAPTSIESCATCHGAHDSRKPTYKGDCAGCHLEPRIALIPVERRGAFSHRLHLPAERAHTKEDCARCHDGALTSIDLRDGKLLGAVTAACERCHVPDPSGGPKAASTSTSGHASAAARGGEAPKDAAKAAGAGGASTGADKMSGGSTKAPAPPPRAAKVTLTTKAAKAERFFTELSHAAHAKALDCAACHRLEKNDRYAFVVKGLPGYEGCISCHAKDGWAVKDHGTPIQCGRCHESASPAIRQVAVTKSGLGEIAFGSVSHPFLGERDTAEACAKCHYRARETISSAIGGKPFSHRAHKAERCESCHAGLAKSEGPATSREVDLGATCSRCHEGDAPKLAGTPARKETRAPFSHASHLAAQGKREALTQGCAACHTLDAGKDAVATPADVLSCKRCHDHKNHADVTGQDLDKCIKCHTSDSLFREQTKVVIERPDVERADMPYQRHDWAQGECSRCHAAAPIAVERRLAASVTHRNEPHVGLELSSCGKCHVRPKGF